MLYICTDKSNLLTRQDKTYNLKHLIMMKSLSRALFFSALSVASVSAMAQTAELLVHQNETKSTVCGMSPNGKWAVGYAPGEKEGDTVCPFLWNLETDEVTYLTEDVLALAGAYDVDDNGIIVGSLENQPAIYKDGNWETLPIPENFDYGIATGVSADGAIIIGWAGQTESKEEGGTLQICKWVNKQLADIQTPEKDWRGEKATANQLFNISADGNTILGYLNYTLPKQCTPVIWNPDPVIVAEDLIYNDEGKRNYTEIYDNIHLSPNGKYVVGFVSYDKGDYNSEETFLYNIETKATERYDYGIMPPNPTIIGRVIDNYGTIYEATYSVDGGPIRTAYIRINGEQTLLNDFLLDRYGLDIMEVSEYNDLGTTIEVSSDGKTLIGFEGPGGNWCLKLSEPATIKKTVNNSQTISVVVNGNTMIINGDAQQVTLTDLTGKAILSQPVSGNSINLGGLEKGVYVAIIQTNGQNHVQKIMIK